MKTTTLTKLLALAAGVLLTATAATAKVNKPDGGNVIISKVFYSASKGAESGNYAYGQYIELYNNSADSVDISGLYIGLVESEAAATAYSVSAVEADEDLKAKLNGKVVLKQLFQIPADTVYAIAPGTSVVICNSAIDHTSLAKTGHDLSAADFEVKTSNTKYTHNDAVKALTMVYSFNSSTDFMNLSYSGPAGVVLLKNNEKAVDLENTVFARGKDKGSQYVVANLYYCVDAVDILANTAKGIDETTKRIGGTTYDGGYATTAATGTYNGETVCRRTAFVTHDGRMVLFDTNNSSTDFMASATAQPRQYDSTVAGLSDTTIVIPASGYQVVRTTMTFCGPNDLFIVYLTGNKKNQDITYNNLPADSVLIDKGTYIAVGQPGTYTLQLSEAQPIQRVPSNLLTWSDDDCKELTGGQATRSIYKFCNEPGNVGFRRVAATADGKYNVATFSGDDRLYLTLTADMVEAFYAANGAASAADLDFIHWHGATPADTVAAVTAVSAVTASGTVYDLQGRRVVCPAKGLYIRNGKKFIVR